MTGIQNGDNITATYTTTATSTSPPGTYAILPTLVDPGGKLGNYTVTSVSGQLSVVQDSTNITIASTTPRLLGDAVTFLAGVTAVFPGSGTPTEIVTFKDGATTLGTATLSSGQASFSISTLSAGSHSITAQYSGDPNFLPSYGNFTQQVEDNICVLYDQTKAVQAGANVPIKLYLCDLNGKNVSSSSIVLHAIQVVGIPGFSGDPETPGNSNPDNDFVFDSRLGTTGGYRFNLKTTGLASGTYSLLFTVTNDPVMHSVNFGVK